MFSVQTLFDNLNVSNSVDWQFDFHGAVLIADSSYSISCTMTSKLRVKGSLSWYVKWKIQIDVIRVEWFHIWKKKRCVNVLCLTFIVRAEGALEGRTKIKH